MVPYLTPAHPMKSLTPSNAFAHSKKMMVVRSFAKGAIHGNTSPVTILARKYRRCTTVLTVSHGPWTIVVPMNDNGSGGSERKARMWIENPNDRAPKLRRGNQKRQTRMNHISNDMTRVLENNRRPRKPRDPTAPRPQSVVPQVSKLSRETVDPLLQSL